MKVLKFGGTSVADAAAIARVKEIVSNCIQREETPIVVTSALSGVTDQLVNLSRLAAKGSADYIEALTQLRDRHFSLANEVCSKQNLNALEQKLKDLFSELEKALQGVSLIKELSPKTLDLVMSFGERLSTPIITEALKLQIADAECLDARTIIATDHNFGNAKVNIEKTYQQITNHFAEHKSLQVVTGFIAASDDGSVTTLGRGGSDYTAAILGAALDVTAIEIWSDVSGVLTADPRKVKRAFTIAHVNYEEAMELSHFGAKIIYPPTIQPAFDKNIPILVKNTFAPQEPGTKISSEKPKTEHPITGISSIDKIALLQLQGSGLVGVAGVAGRLFSCLARNKISVILISQASSEHSICFAVRPEDALLAKKALESEFATEISSRRINEPIVEKDLSIVAVVGENMRHMPGISGRLFQALGRNGINVRAIAQGSSELNISAVISKADEAKALNAIHDAFFLSDLKTINLFMVGLGQVGNGLLRQIDEQLETYKNERLLEIKVVGLANSKQMFFDDDGIDINSWQQTLQASGEAVDIKRYVQQMLELNLSNTVFVDCTASIDMPQHYEAILEGSISIVTPNKKANSGPFSQYQLLKRTAQKRNVKFFYETNVGAGLPVLNTLSDLTSSGDEIISIEAVLSGTLSYIFNSFSGDKSFSAIVKEAKEKGYTEPDPRDDLSGNDVGRKLLILAREIGLELNEADIAIENLVPEPCRKIKDVAEFMTTLPAHDADYSARKQKAELQGEKLRYIGKIADGKASVKLEAVGSEHPFYSLSGSDNIISFRTKRYNERPLVVKGPGAGIDVTAAGVLADILRVASYLS